MKELSTLRLTLVLLAAFSAAVPAAGAPRDAAPKPLVIGGTLPLTGKFAEMGRMQEKGYRLWEAETNGKGGLLGRPVKLLIVDDESLAARAVAAYAGMLKRRAVDLVTAPYSSEITLPVAEVVERYRFPMLTAGAASEKIWETPRRYTFGVYSTADRYFIGFLELCAANRIVSVSITGFSDPFSRYTAEGARKWAGKFGLKVAHFNILDDANPATVAAEAARIGSADPGAVVVAGFLNETVAIRTALARTPAKSAVFAGSVGPAMPEFPGRLGPLAEGVFGASQWEPDERIPYSGSRAFIGNFRTTYGGDPSYHAASAYASMTLLGSVVEKVGAVDRERIRQGIVSGDHRTIMGPFRLREDGTQVGHRSIIIQWQRGRKEIVWPEKMKTAPAVFR